MTNSKTSYAGAITVLGTALMGVGIIPQLEGAPRVVLSYIAVTGFVLTALGQALGHLWAADAQTLKDVATEVRANTAAVIELQSDGEPATSSANDNSPSKPVSPASPLPGNTVSSTTRVPDQT